MYFQIDWKNQLHKYFDAANFQTYFPAARRIVQTKSVILSRIWFFGIMKMHNRAAGRPSGTFNCNAICMAKTKTPTTAKAGSSKTQTSRSSTKKTTTSTAKAARKPNAAFMKPVQPSEELAHIVGKKALSRPELTKKIWAYIKKNGLQDEKNKRMIKADEQLKPIFGGRSQVNMFEMTKLVNKHVS
jgi:upstream activation factor subunit UAF30